MSATRPATVAATDVGGEVRAEVGAVLIGRDEGERLARAVSAVADHVSRVVYVDANSSDGSREVAARLGAAVVHLERGPFTPSRGRQAGFEELVRRRSTLRFVQFIDGDCVLDPRWLALAVRYLEEHGDVGAVFGRRREERCSESLYSRLLDVDWAAAPGDAANFGGDALVRVRAMEEAGGWCADTINAEDMDVSFRIREKGWRIVRLPDAMTSHDVRMSRFAEYWRRAVRAGYGFAEVGLRHRKGRGGFLVRRMLSSYLYAAVLPAVVLIGLAWFWPLAVAGLALYVRNIVVTALHCRRKGASWSVSASYAVLNLVCKAAMAIGSTRFFLDRLLRRRTPSDHLVVYRSQGQKG